MIVELNYWDMFWSGVIAGWVIYWCVTKVLNISVSSGSSHSRPNYIKPTKFEYKTPNYFKHVPVKEFRSQNQGQFPQNDKAPPKPKHNPHK